MSARNTLEAKAARRQRKLFRAPLPSRYDVFHWLKLQRPMSNRMAMAVIHAGAVRTRGGNVIRERFINPDFKGELVIRPPKDDDA